MHQGGRATNVSWVPRTRISHVARGSDHCSGIRNLERDATESTVPSYSSRGLYKGSKAGCLFFFFTFVVRCEENKIHPAPNGGAERHPKAVADRTGHQSTAAASLSLSHPQASASLLHFYVTRACRPELYQFISHFPIPRTAPRNQGQPRTKNHPRPLHIAQTSVTARREREGGRAQRNSPIPPPTGTGNSVCSSVARAGRGRASVPSSSSGRVGFVPDFG